MSAPILCSSLFSWLSLWRGGQVSQGEGQLTFRAKILSRQGDLLQQQRAKEGVLKRQVQMALPPLWLHRPSIPGFLPLAWYHQARHPAPSAPRLAPPPPTPVPVSRLAGHPARSGPRLELPPPVPVPVPLLNCHPAPSGPRLEPPPPVPVPVSQLEGHPARSLFPQGPR